MVSTPIGRHHEHAFPQLPSQMQRWVALFNAIAPLFEAWQAAGSLEFVVRRAEPFTSSVACREPLVNYGFCLGVSKSIRLQGGQKMGVSEVGWSFGSDWEAVDCFSG
jgi:hypothetical protein